MFGVKLSKPVIVDVFQRECHEVAICEVNMPMTIMTIMRFHIEVGILLLLSCDLL